MKRGFIEESIKLSDKLLDHFLKQEKFVDAFSTIKQQELIIIQHIYRVHRKKGSELVLHYNKIGQKVIQQISNLNYFNRILIELEDFKLQNNRLEYDINMYYEKLILIPTYSVKSLYNRLIGLNIIYTIKDSPKELIKNQKEMIHLIKNNPIVFGLNSRSHIKQAINLMLILINQGKYDESENVISDLIIEYKSLKDNESKNLFTILFDFNTIISHWNFKTVQDIYSEI